MTRIARIPSTLVVAAALAMVGTTCRHFTSEAHPLYEGEPLPSAEVAKLSGPVAKVDGVDVSDRGSLFALLPGCHVVELPTSLGEGTASGAWSVTLGHVSYALAMKPGHHYVIETQTLRGNAASVGNATVGGVKVTAVERDGEGKLIAKLAQVRSRADIEKCRAADDGLRPQAKPATLPEQPSALPVAPASPPSAQPMDGGVDSNR